MPKDERFPTATGAPYVVRMTTHGEQMEKALEAAGWPRLIGWFPQTAAVIRHSESVEDPAQRIVDMWAWSSKKKFGPREGVYSQWLFPDALFRETPARADETERAIQELTGESERRAMAREVERLKSRLIAEGRGKRAQADRIKVLESHFDGALQRIGELTNLNAALQAVVLARAQGTVCMREMHRGVVTDVQGDEVVVVYETKQGPVEQVYTRQQFRDGKVPDQGDNVTAYVILTRAPKDVEQRFAEMESEEKPDEFAAFREKGVSGPIEI